MESGHPNSDSPMEITRPMINDRIPPKYENRELSQINFKKNRKIDQQKLPKEAPPNLIYSDLGFSLFRTLHARRKGA